MQEVLEKERTPGISGLVRYYNDGHTVIPCLESLKGVFDEIIFAYQPHEDGFDKEVLNAVIEGKIPELEGINIIPVDYRYNPVIKGSPKEMRDPRNSLANYYNTGLLACNKNKFMKIDTDQIYFNSVIKSIIKSNSEPNIIKYPFGVNYILTETGDEVSPALAPLNGMYGDTLVVDFSMKPFFMQGVRWEYLKLSKLFTKSPSGIPAWLHITQPRRPRNFHAELHSSQKNTFPSCIRDVPEHELKWALAKAKEAVIASRTSK